MKNPWEEISLTDYENHMKLDSVMQLQAMKRMMKDNFWLSKMILLFKTQEACMRGKFYPVEFWYTI